MLTSKRLYDVLTRKQIYLEGVKLYQEQLFNLVLLDLKNQLTKLFQQLKYKRLNDMTKGALIAFIKQLREVQSEVYGKYTTQLFKDLLDFMETDLEMSKIIFVTLFEDFPNGDAKLKYADLILEKRNDENKQGVMPVSWLTDNQQRLFSAIQNAPIPANGILLFDFINNFVDSASNSIENIVRQGYANADSTEDVFTSIVGAEELNYKDGQFNRLYNQNAALIATVFEHESAIVEAGVASVLFASYVWALGIAKRHTNICLSRAGNVYIYGQGPLPPAHIGCVSKAIPIINNDDYEPPESFQVWANGQPEEVQKEMLTAEETPLTIKEYKSKLPLILKR